MTIGLPQIIYCALLFMALGLSLAQHGQTKPKTENFWTTLLAVIIQLALMWWGGFFG
jgi:hypothetical protein